MARAAAAADFDRRERMEVSHSTSSIGIIQIDAITRVNEV
jgi:hypothetical protein